MCREHTHTTHTYIDIQSISLVIRDLSFSSVKIGRLVRLKGKSLSFRTNVFLYVQFANICLASVQQANRWKTVDGTECNSISDGIRTRTRVTFTLCLRAIQNPPTMRHKTKKTHIAHTAERRHHSRLVVEWPAPRHFSWIYFEMI